MDLGLLLLSAGKQLVVDADEHDSDEPCDCYRANDEFDEGGDRATRQRGENHLPPLAEGRCRPHEREGDTDEEKSNERRRQGPTCGDTVHWSVGRLDCGHELISAWPG